jgi:hypothetical protein
MGVGLNAWRKVEFVRALREGEEGDEEYPTLIHLHPGDNHPDVADGMVEGLYRVSGDRERALAAEYKSGPADPDQMHGDLGSNGGYERWLEQLEDAARRWSSLRLFRPFLNLDPVHDRILVGPKTAASFWRAFAARSDRCHGFAKTLTRDEAGFFVLRYEGFLGAFLMAKGGGAVFTS